eukprot:CAMPEP_0185449998 /NCGR_PEP_ID=MMETSP1365-20130426/61963_1 /TAXON_ID=38817 /ORGANISM="Gephyrocapsa oceanica, Strain RCC1303" /LENGTH=93 /DNA_ID=CAMNT_0028056059 /DNA_START=14 /DNA_END=292 /DNA_ORIENTATION=+
MPAAPLGCASLLSRAFFLTAFISAAISWPPAPLPAGTAPPPHAAAAAGAWCRPLLRAAECDAAAPSPRAAPPRPSASPPAPEVASPPAATSRA